jgi:hypothetical protein
LDWEVVRTCRGFRGDVSQLTQFGQLNSTEIYRKSPIDMLISHKVENVSIVQNNRDTHDSNRDVEKTEMLILAFCFV